MNFVNYLYTPKSERQEIKLPSVRIRSITQQDKQSKSNLRKQVYQSDEQTSILNKSRIDNIIMLEQMSFQIQQLKSALTNTPKERKLKYFLLKKKQKNLNITQIDNLQDHSIYIKQYEVDINQELKQIKDSRQKFMRCVMDTRQRNRSLQIYGDNLSPVIDQEKEIYKKQNDSKAQQILLDSIRKQYTQRSPMGNAYCGIKALNKRSQDKVLRRLM